MPQRVDDIFGQDIEAGNGGGNFLEIRRGVQGGVAGSAEGTDDGCPPLLILYSQRLLKIDNRTHHF